MAARFQPGSSDSASQSGGSSSLTSEGRHTLFPVDLIWKQFGDVINNSCEASRTLTTTWTSRDEHRSSSKVFRSLWNISLITDHRYQHQSALIPNTNTSIDSLIDRLMDHIVDRQEPMNSRRNALMWLTLRLNVHQREVDFTHTHTHTHTHTLLR